MTGLPAPLALTLVRVATAAVFVIHGVARTTLGLLAVALADREGYRLGRNTLVQR